MEKKINKCPKCGSEEKQHKCGKTECGTQRIRCAMCKKKYSIEPKNRGYSAEMQRKAMKLLIDGMSGREIGRQLGMSKANVYNWAKKNCDNVDKNKNKN